VVELVQLDPIELKVSVPQEYLGNLQKTFASAEGPPQVEVRVGSLQQAVTGTLVEIIPQADERTRAVPVVIRIPNPGTNETHALFPGLLAEVSLGIGDQESAVMVPKDALVLGQGTTVVFAIRQEGAGQVARRIDVRTGGTAEGWIAVEGEIEAGDIVVTHGNERLRDGQPVRIGKDDSSRP
jgi:RND family efflux transporter MFP subunit